MTNFDKVGIFMKTFGQEIKLDPSFSTDKINKLNQKQINSTIQDYIDPTIFVTSVAGSRI